MTKYLLLFEDWKVKTFNIQEYLPNAEEIKEINKVKQYFTWWYSHPDVISKINSWNQEIVSKKLLDFINKKLVPSEFRIFRTKIEEDKYWKNSGDDSNKRSKDSAIAWVLNPKEYIYYRGYVSTDAAMLGILIHEFAHIIQLFAGQYLLTDLHNSTAPKGLYGTDSLKSGLFIPPLDPKSYEKKYEKQEIEQFARFHTMRYYFGIKPNDDCNKIYQKLKTAIAESKLNKKDGYSFMKIKTINKKHYLFISKYLGDFDPNLYWYFKAYIKPTEDEKMFKKYVNSFENFIGFYKYFIELSVICDDHKNIVSNFDIEETNFA